MSCGRPHETPCSQILASLSAYIDGEVEAQEYRLIAIHITECAPCEQQVRVQRTVKALVIRASDTASAPASLHTRIRTHVSMSIVSDPEDPKQ
ncbi:MAG: zf-HC2 domain-containing protein [Candidatus Nanopelagicales bacterium]|jgi:mycothiol system anti-sigma-R factor